MVDPRASPHHTHVCDRTFTLLTHDEDLGLLIAFSFEKTLDDQQEYWQSLFRTVRQSHSFGSRCQPFCPV